MTCCRSLERHCISELMGLKIILGEIIETLVDLEQPLFEDLSEDGSMVLFDDEDFSEDKTDA